MDFRSIACIVGAAHEDRKAALRGALLARQLDARLTLVGIVTIPSLGRGLGGPEAVLPPVVTPAMNDDLKRRTQSVLDELASELSERHGIGVSTRVIEGLHGEALLDQLDGIEFDLIAVAGEHSSAIARILHLDRGTARALSRRAPCPVVVCSGPPQIAVIKHALVGIDFSQASAMAMEVASSLIGSDGFLSVVHVQPEDQYLSPSSGPSDAWSSTSSDKRAPPLRQAETARGLQNFVAARRPNVAVVEHYLEVGKPAQAISELAERIDAHALFVGSHVPEGLGQRIFGTVTDHLIATADLPVFAIPSTVDDRVQDAADEAEPRPRQSRVDRTLEETFPASDPPGWWAGKPGTV